MELQSKDLGNRPLGIGELADKAVTILVKHAVPFALLWLACTIPGMLIAAWGAAIGQPALAGLGQAIAAFGTSIGGLATAALVGKIYAGEDPKWGWALGRGASKILSIIFLGILLLLIAIIPCGLLWLLTAGLFTSLAATNPGVAIVAAALPGLALLVSFSIMYLVQYIASNAIVIEDRGAPEALGKAFGYMFHEGRFWPNLALAICLTIVVYGGSLVSGMAAALIIAKVNLGFGQAIETILTATVGALGATVAAVFYFDMRMRYDGYDLEQSLDALETPAAT